MRIGIIGAGTWGMALARMLSNSGHGVQVWSPHPATVDRLAATRTQKNLPDMIIPEAVRFTKEMEEVCKDKEMLVFAVPSVYVRSAMHLPVSKLLSDCPCKVHCFARVVNICPFPK